MRTVELHAAFMYDCDECGKENFVRAITPEVEEHERAELFEAMGISDEDDLIPTLVPIEVTCIHCGTMFETDTDALDGYVAEE